MKTIASVGGEMPIDLLEATGRYSGPLGWDIDRATPVAEQWVESRFVPWVRSVLEDWAAGMFDGHSHIVFSRGDDNAQRLYYYVCELQRQGLIAGPEPLIFDIAHIGRSTSLARTAAGVERLAVQLGLDEAALEAAIVKTNALRLSQSSVGQRPRVLLAGTLPPDDRLHQMAAASGWTGVGETLAQNWADPGPRVEEGSGAPAQVIAAQLYARASGPRAFFDRAGGLVEQARSCGAQAVILWLIEEEEGLVWHVPAQRRALEEAWMPHLVLTRRNWAARDGVAEEIRAFLEGVEG